MNSLYKQELYEIFDQSDLYDFQDEFWKTNFDELINNIHRKYSKESKVLNESEWNELHDEANMGNLKTFSNFVYEIFLDYFEGFKERGF